MNILEQIDEANRLASASFRSGDLAGGIAALVLATQLLQLAKLQERIKRA